MTPAFSSRPLLRIALAFMLLFIFHGVADADEPGADLATPPPITLALGRDHTCALVDGGLRCWGSNSFGQLGAGDNNDRPVPAPVTGLGSEVQAVSAGLLHTCAVVNGGVKCWGSNAHGELGNGTFTDSAVPVAVSGLGSGVKDIAAGDNHTCALLNNGAVKCWGMNANGQLGSPGWSSEIPRDVVGLSNVKALVGGTSHTCALLDSGTVKCWGYNYYGSLGNGNNADQTTPVDVLGLSAVKQIGAGYIHSCALLNDGSVKCWGVFHGFAQNNTPAAVAGFNGLSAIATDGSFLCGLENRGNVKCMGANSSGQLGDGTTTNREAPVAVLGLSNVTSIAAGFGHMCAVVNNAVRCWGNDARGQLGIGNSSYVRSPLDDLTGVNYAAISIGNLHVCGVTTAGAAKCWGAQYNGELGIGPAQMGAIYYSPQSVNGLGSGVQAIVAGLQYSCAVVNGAAKCWGRNSEGQLGTGAGGDANTPANVAGLSSGVTRIAASNRAGGGDHTCAVVGGSARCWGDNDAGQLGNGQVGGNSNTPVAVANLAAGVSDIAAGAQHSCAVVNGGVQCWGSAYYGQLGNGVAGTSTRYPTAVAVSGLGSGATAVVAGHDFACALVNGAVKCWGRGEAGQLGHPSWPALSATPLQVSGLENGVTAISAWRDQACAVKDGAVYCWGGGKPTPEQVYLLDSGYTGVAAGGEASCAVGAEGTLCWGAAMNGKLGDGREVRRPQPMPVVGFGPAPELYLHYTTAQPGSLLAIVGANMPAWANIPLLANGQLLGTIRADAQGFFRTVLKTAGAAPGYYKVTALANGAAVETGFTLDNAAPLRAAEGGATLGVILNLMSGTPPPPAPSPTPSPTPIVGAPAPVVSQVFPNQGALDQPAQVEIYGANFQPGAVARLEQPGAVTALRTIYNTSTHLTVMWPGGLQTATYAVTVLNPDWSKGTLPYGYTAVDLAPANPADDLYGFNYELTSNQVYEFVDEPTWVWFVVHRLGGAGDLNNVRVRFYVGAPGLTDPVTQATLIGEGSIATLPPNSWRPVNVAWTPTQAGTFALYAVIDPDNAIAEPAGNNLYHRGVQVKVHTPPDRTPPVVDAVSAPIKTSSGSAMLSITAHDEGGSGLAWMDIVVWEYFPSLRAWLATEETGWMPYDATYVHTMGYFSGPRYLDVWVADAAKNISLQPGSALVNYLKPDNFIMPGESQLYLFPLAQNAAFSANMTLGFAFDDADLYLWPPDYPAHNYWVSANTSAAEQITINAPVAGFYWLEVYGYQSAFYNLSVVNGADAAMAADAPAANPLRTTRVGIATEPSHLYRPTSGFDRIYLPVVQK